MESRGLFQIFPPVEHLKLCWRFSDFSSPFGLMVSPSYKTQPTRIPPHTTDNNLSTPTAPHVYVCITHYTPIYITHQSNTVILALIKAPLVLKALCKEFYAKKVWEIQFSNSVLQPNICRVHLSSRQISLWEAERCLGWQQCSTTPLVVVQIARSQAAAGTLLDEPTGLYSTPTNITIQPQRRGLPTGELTRCSTLSRDPPDIWRGKDPLGHSSPSEATTSSLHKEQQPPSPLPLIRLSHPIQ